MNYVHQVDSEIDFSTVFTNLHQELENSNNPIKKAISLTVRSDPKTTKYDNYLKKKATFLDMMEAVVSNTKLVQMLSNELLQNAVGPYIIFLARLLEELKSPTRLSELITEDAYKYLEQHGEVLLKNFILNFSSNFLNWKLDVVDWYFESQDKPCEVMTTFAVANDKWHKTLFKRFKLYYTFSNAGWIQIVAFGELLTSSSPQGHQVTISDFTLELHQGKVCNQSVHTDFHLFSIFVKQRRVHILKYDFFFSR